VTPADHQAFCDLWRDVMDWLPPAGADDDPAGDWREISADAFRAYREVRDRELVQRFEAILAAERRGIERDMQATMPREPDPTLHPEPDTAPRLH